MYRTFLNETPLPTKDLNQQLSSTTYKAGVEDADHAESYYYRVNSKTRDL